MITARVFITGVVQGVGFRQFVKDNAQKMGIAGWAANSPASPPASSSLGGPASRLGGPEGKVEAVFQTDISSDEGKNKIQELIEICKKGPFMSEVRGIEINWKESSERFEGFEIRK